MPALRARREQRCSGAKFNEYLPLSLTTGFRIKKSYFEEQFIIRLSSCLQSLVSTNFSTEPPFPQLSGTECSRHWAPTANSPPSRVTFSSRCVKCQRNSAMRDSSPTNLLAAPNRLRVSYFGPLKPLILGTVCWASVKMVKMTVWSWFENWFFITAASSSCTMIEDHDLAKSYHLVKLLSAFSSCCVKWACYILDFLSFIL